jgi:hypothetical protein
MMTEEVPTEEAEWRSFEERSRALVGHGSLDGRGGKTRESKRSCNPRP